jgi:hypothetical protein
MASFAEGLVRGLQQQQETNLRRSEQRRQQAITMADLAAKEEERDYVRQQRQKQEKAMTEIQQLQDSVFGYDEDVPAQAMPGQAPGAAPTQKVRKYYDIYDSTPEGRERQLRYHSGYTRILMNNGMLKPEDIKASNEYANYLNKSGLADAGLNLYLTDGKDQNSLKFLAKKLNLNPDTVKVTGSLVDGSAKIEAVTLDGQTMTRPLDQMFSALGIDAFDKIKARQLEERKTEAAITESGARTEAARASAALSGVRGRVLESGGAPKLKEFGDVLYTTAPPGKSPGKMAYGKELQLMVANTAMEYGANKNDAVAFAAQKVKAFQLLPGYKDNLLKAAKAFNDNPDNENKIRLLNASDMNNFEQAYLKNLVEIYLEGVGVQEMQDRFSGSSSARRSAINSSDSEE